MAAILGLQLASLARVLGDTVQGREIGLSALWSYIGILGVIIGIAAAIALRDHSEDLEVAQTYYQQAARVSSHTILEPPEQTPRVVQPCCGSSSVDGHYLNLDYGRPVVSYSMVSNVLLNWAEAVAALVSLLTLAVVPAIISRFGT